MVSFVQFPKKLMSVMTVITFIFSIKLDVRALTGFPSAPRRSGPFG